MKLNNDRTFHYDWSDSLFNSFSTIEVPIISLEPQLGNCLNEIKQVVDVIYPDAELFNRITDHEHEYVIFVREQELTIVAWVDDYIKYGVRYGGTEKNYGGRSLLPLVEQCLQYKIEKTYGELEKLIITKQRLNKL